MSQAAGCRLSGIVALAATLTSTASLNADDRQLRDQVHTAIEHGRGFLARAQNQNGSWTSPDNRYGLGTTSLALLALLNSGLDTDSDTIQDGLLYLRRSMLGEFPARNYEIALAIMAMVAADDDRNDSGRINALARRLEGNQITAGPNSGLWGYERPHPGGDRSNGQFAVLGLRDAVLYGAPVDRSTWERVRKHWVDFQNEDGGWGYALERPYLHSTGSMTAAGVATLAICQRMLRDSRRDLDAAGKPRCCPESRDSDGTQQALEAGIGWLDRHFRIGANPRDRHTGRWVLYYHYAIERAGRLNRLRFFGDRDWYREGARYYVKGQGGRGSWKGDMSGHERDPIIATSLSLLFLSKGLSPVLINKLEYSARDPSDRTRALSGDWNNHPADVANLTELITGLQKWPKLMTSQVVNIHKLKPDSAIEELMQSKVLVITGSKRPDFDQQQIELLRGYVDHGGFIFAVRNCGSDAFDAGFRDLIRKMYPAGDAELRRLPDDHPVFRSEYQFDADTVELWGVDFGCRTAVMYSPEDLSCLWDKWTVTETPGRSHDLKSMILRNMRIGVNVVAYATGREPPSKLDIESGPVQREFDSQIGASLRIVKLRHEGGWDTAPQALRNLVLALNQRVGLTASTRKDNLPLTDPAVKQFPVLYMHGRYGFSLNRQEQDQLRKHIDNGAVLFADACCGSELFDKSFRDQMDQVFPDHKLNQIPPQHEIFDMTTGLGHRISQATLRVQSSGRGNARLESREQTGQPYLEGIEIDGRYAVVYSKYDLSCALERQSTVACTGYVTEDALRIAVNIVLYAMLQDISLRPSPARSAGEDGVR